MPLRTQRPAAAFVTPSVYPALSMRRMPISLSPVELPCSVSVRAPATPFGPANATVPVLLLKTSAALFAVAASALFPKFPEESMVAFPARVKRRSVLMVGVCVFEKMAVFAPVY